MYPLGYYPHNYHVMWYALNMLGRSEEAIRTARTIGEKVPPEVVQQVPALEYLSPTLLYTLARFSRWDGILKQPAPPASLRYTNGIWHYVRALAYAAQDRPDSAVAERSRLDSITEGVPADEMMNLNRARALLAIAQRHLAGEMAAAEGRTDEAVKRLEAAVRGEDALTYDEPPAWYMPLRQRLGAVLLAAGRPKEAEQAYREDLVRRPENGWSLHGLAESLRAQKRIREADRLETRFRKAWDTADVTLAAMTP